MHEASLSVTQPSLALSPGKDFELFNSFSSKRVVNDPKYNKRKIPRTKAKTIEKQRTKENIAVAKELKAMLGYECIPFFLYC